MTCIVAIADGTSVWMGGDSALTDKTSIQEYGHSKIFLKNSVATESVIAQPILIGGCGSPRMLQLLEYGLEIPSVRPTEDLLRWLSVDFIDEVRKLFKDKGLQKNNMPETFGPSDFIIGLLGQVFHIYNDYQCVVNTLQEDAAGSGYSYAMGSLFTSRCLSMTSEDRIKIALEAAAANSPTVAPPFTFLSI